MTGAFVRVIPKEGFGSVTLVDGARSFHATRGEPQQVSFREWETFLKPSGKFELAPPSDAKATEGRATEPKKSASKKEPR